MNVNKPIIKQKQHDTSPKNLYFWLFLEKKKNHGNIGQEAEDTFTNLSEFLPGYFLLAST